MSSGQRALAAFHILQRAGDQYVLGKVHFSSLPPGKLAESSEDGLQMRKDGSCESLIRSGRRRSGKDSLRRQKAAVRRSSLICRENPDVDVVRSTAETDQG